MLPLLTRFGRVCFSSSCVGWFPMVTKHMVVEKKNGKKKIVRRRETLYTPLPATLPEPATPYRFVKIRPAYNNPFAPTQVGPDAAESITEGRSNSSNSNSLAPAVDPQTIDPTSYSNKSYYNSKLNIQSSAAFDRLVRHVTETPAKAEYPMVGKSWSAEILRIKSNEDLEKLWWVLQMEKNELYTQQSLAKRVRETFMNPGRIKKVCQSMARIKCVLGERERNALPGTNKAALPYTIEKPGKEEAEGKEQETVTRSKQPAKET